VKVADGSGEEKPEIEKSEKISSGISPENGFVFKVLSNVHKCD
jgi:hypothetical protein